MPQEVARDLPVVVEHAGQQPGRGLVAMKDLLVLRCRNPAEYRGEGPQVTGPAWLQGAAQPLGCLGVQAGQQPPQRRVAARARVVAVEPLPVL